MELDISTRLRHLRDSQGWTVSEWLTGRASLSELLTSTWLAKGQVCPVWKRFLPCQRDWVYLSTGWCLA